MPKSLWDSRVILTVQTVDRLLYAKSDLSDNFLACVVVKKSQNECLGF